MDTGAKRQAGALNDEARGNKRQADEDSHNSRRKFEKHYKALLSCLPDESHSHDAYNPTAEQSNSWSKTIQEVMSKHLLEIDAGSRAPHTVGDIAKELDRLHRRSKYDVLIELLSYKPRVEELRVIYVENNEENVQRELEKPCLTPIWFLQDSRYKLSIEDFVSQLCKDKGAEIDVFDPSVQNYDESTRRTTVEEFAETFSQHSKTTFPQNFLNIKNSTGVRFLPRSVFNASLETKCKLKKQRQQKGSKSLGKDLEDVPEDTAAPSEYFIASKKDAYSPSHVDSFGKSGWDHMLDGIKFWYIPAGDRDAIQRDHRAGEVLSGSEQLKIKLDVGKNFIQMPGQIHAVWSQTDCLMVGAHFYTAATFTNSLDCIYEQLTKGIHSNEDGTSEDWATLDTIIRFLDDDEIFTEKESGHAYDSLENLMNNPRLQTFWKTPDSSARPGVIKFRTTARALLKDRVAQKN